MPDNSVLWTRIEAWLEQHLPAVRRDLAPGCSEGHLEDLERRLGHALPGDMRAVYRRHDGQRGEAAALFFGMPFLSLEGLFGDWSTWREVIEDDPSIVTSIPSSSHPPGAIQPHYANVKWLPFATDGGGNNLAVDLDPGPRGTPGQVINFGTDEDQKIVIATSLSDFLAWFVRQLESGNYRVSGADGGQVLSLKEPAYELFLDAVPELFGGR